MTERLIDLLRADYQARKRRVDVMGREVFVTPLTLGEQTRIADMHPNDSALRMAETIICKAVDAEGKPVFTLDDKQDLKRAVGGDRLGPIIAAIVGPSIGEIEKNSAADDQ
jgi:hypothetical protein